MAEPDNASRRTALKAAAEANMREVKARLKKSEMELADRIQFAVALALHEETAGARKVGAAIAANLREDANLRRRIRSLFQPSNPALSAQETQLHTAEPAPSRATQTAVDTVLVQVCSAWSQHQAATFDHAMTEAFSAFVLASIERSLLGALADLKRAEVLGHGEDADFAHDTIEMLTANREALRAARSARGWSEDGDEAS